MAENRKYYYLKLKESFYNSETIIILESMQDGMIYSNLLMKMYLMSLKNNGVLMLNERIPHNVNTIATCTRHQIGTVERALQIFSQLGLIDILKNGAYYMSDIQLFIGKSSSEGERKKKERMWLQQQRLTSNIMEDNCPNELENDKYTHKNGVDKSPPILEIEKDIELEIDKEIECINSFNHIYGRYKNVCLTDSELNELKTELPNRWECYIERLSEYIASTGREYQNHAATIRRWAANDDAKNIKKQGIPNYTFKEGDSL